MKGTLHKTEQGLPIIKQHKKINYDTERNGLGFGK
jgi:hypothetical protein